MPFGRPTKYNEEVQKKADNYINQFDLNKDVPYIEELALLLDIDDETVTEWAKVNKDFSATVKRIKLMQRLRLQKISYDKEFTASGAIFQLKANHGMIETEKKIVEAEVKGVDFIKDN